MTNKQKATAAVRACLLAACALLVAGPVPARAAALPESVPGNWLYVTVTRGDARSFDTRGTLLLCDPPQGHAQAVRACAELGAAHGDVGRIPLRDAYCPMVHAPVAASARGEWGGRTVTYGETFSNSCVMAARTGAVFALPHRSG
ncbi:SSI family serine proteinase inhibitor [Streptomyces sp. Qhu-G9]|uniref:SSI family serine proteinase inhibitor n=1 Tax=Streptomyces sp. Qhu-G9 TaxID=3452799 RepID=UPI0022AC3291|nr:SSI family serine proteinase inhibitor [Streptomyces aurantiacus]WAU84309.1 SSI family serine proteinase inhibitor [Streptomyces aurantiacus]